MSVHPHDSADSALHKMVSRRELLRRLAYLGFGTAAAAHLPGCPGGSKWAGPKEHSDGDEAAAGAESNNAPRELRLNLANYTADGMHEWQAGTLKGFVFKDAAGQWLALSRSCTHSRCPVSWRENEGDFFCRCHKSRFDAQGNVLQGPAKRALPNYPVREEGSELVLDLSGVQPTDFEKAKGGSSERDDDDDDQDEDEHRGRGRGRGGDDFDDHSDEEGGWNP
jgi:nitrite reductase/ring-hydroxylating ferredoxin subunit